MNMHTATWEIKWRVMTLNMGHIWYCWFTLGDHLTRISNSRSYGYYFEICKFTNETHFYQKKRVKHPHWMLTCHRTLFWKKDTQLIQSKLSFSIEGNWQTYSTQIIGKSPLFFQGTLNKLADRSGNRLVLEQT